MSRFLSFLTFIVCLSFSMTAFCDEAGDIRQVRNVITRYEDGVFTGDAQKIISCFAPDFVAYSTVTDSLSMYTFRGDSPYFDPDFWYVTGIGPEFIRKHAERFTTYPEKLRNNPDYRHVTTISHVSVNGDRALAVTSHKRMWRDLDARETVTREHRTVWMLSRIRGEWKVTSYISPITWYQSVMKMSPVQ